MTEKSPAEIRVELSQGHWVLEEYVEALRCLERAVDQPAASASLLGMIDSFLAEVERHGVPAEVSEGLHALRERLAPELPPEEPDESEIPVATPTMAELLADQGHTERALRVAEEVLRRNPEDERARAVQARIRPQRSLAERQIAALEGWLAGLMRRKEGGAYA